MVLCYGSPSELTQNVCPRVWIDVCMCVKLQGVIETVAILSKLILTKRGRYFSDPADCCM